MNYGTHSRTERRGWGRLAITLTVLSLLILGATFFSGSFFKLGTLRAGEVFDAASASAHMAGGTETPGTPSTTTTPGTGTTTTTPGTTTTTPGTTTSTTTPGTTGTTTPGSTTTTTTTPGPGCSGAETATISIIPGGFNPQVLNVNANTRVTWVNNTSDRARIRDINHNLFDSGDFQPGQSWSYVFCVNGIYVYENARDEGEPTGVVNVGSTGGTPSTTPGTPGTMTTTPGTTTTTTTTPGTTGTAGSTTTTTPGTTTTTTPGSTTTTTPGSTGTPGSTTTTTPGGTSTTNPTGTTTSTPGNTTTTTPGSTGTTTTTPGTTGTATTVASVTPSACAVQFTDVPQGSTFYEFVRCLACKGILGGYPDGTFRPNDAVTRGQLAKIVSNAAGYNDPVSGQTFTDVPVGHTFYEFIERVAMHGVVGGYEDGTFRPGNNATRGQIAKIVSIAANFNDAVSGQTFADVPIDSTFYLYVERLAMRSIMSGYACGSVGEPCNPSNDPYFRPAMDATRGQVAKIVSNSFFPNCAP